VHLLRCGAWAALAAEWPSLRDVWLRFAGLPVRLSGTMGGNVANGSPIGDSAPVLIALDATVRLRRAGPEGAVIRELPLAALYRDYRVQDRAPGEWIERVHVPRRGTGTRLFAYKLSKRFEQDISAVSLGLAFRERDGRLADVRIAFGGLAGIVRRSPTAEAALEGAVPSAAAFACWNPIFSSRWSRRARKSSMASGAVSFARI
jgi:xanthine dehydrogenase small subunit